MSDLEQLKTDAVKCLTDSLFKKLLDVEEVENESNLFNTCFYTYQERIRMCD